MLLLFRTLDTCFYRPCCPGGLAALAALQVLAAVVVAPVHILNTKRFQNILKFLNGTLIMFFSIHFYFYFFTLPRGLRANTFGLVFLFAFFYFFPSLEESMQQIEKRHYEHHLYIFFLLCQKIERLKKKDKKYLHCTERKLVFYSNMQVV